MTKTTKLLNWFYGITLLLFLLDNMDSFDIKNQALKSYVYWGFLIGTPIVLVWNAFRIKLEFKPILQVLIPLIAMMAIFGIRPLQILFASGAWRTQTVIYRHGYFGFKTIEFQMQDIGALGYNKRIVEVTYLTPFFIITNEVPPYNDIRRDYLKVDIEVNELGIIEP